MVVIIPSPLFSSWVGADGDDEVCGCCQTSCGQRKGRSLPSDSGMGCVPPQMLLMHARAYNAWTGILHVS